MIGMEATAKTSGGIGVGPGAITKFLSIEASKKENQKGLLFKKAVDQEWTFLFSRDFMGFRIFFVNYFRGQSFKRFISV
jgi:hypothetical protein